MRWNAKRMGLLGFGLGLLAESQYEELGKAAIKPLSRLFSLKKEINPR